MPESLIELLDSEVACEGLLDCIYGLNDLDRECFRTLAERDGRMTVDEVATAVDRERSTAYRSVRRLREAGVVRQHQRTFDGGSYCHVYEPVEARELAGEMQRLMTDWYAEMGQLVREFEEKYGDERESTTPVES